MAFWKCSFNSVSNLFVMLSSMVSAVTVRKAVMTSVPN